MKSPVLVLVSLFIAFSAASAHSLRGDFEADVVSRNLEGECVSGGSSYVGCFEDRVNNRAISYQVDGQGHSAEECEAACKSKDYTIFARQWKGQCFCSNDTDYDKHGATTGCDCCGDNVGGRKMCVWMNSATYLGCYKNKNLDRALPFKVDGRRHSTQDCQVECGKMGMKYFAREWKGQCFCSEDADYDKHGSASGCDCDGKNVGANKMCVWSV